MTTKTPLQQLHDLLYSAQRSTGMEQHKHISEARTVLSKLMAHKPEQAVHSNEWGPMPDAGTEADVPPKQSVIDLALQHGAASYTNRADTAHPAYGFTEEGLVRFAEAVAASVLTKQPNTGNVYDTDWQVSRAHDEMDRLDIPKGDNDSMYTILGRFRMAFEMIAGMRLHVPVTHLCGQASFKWVRPTVLLPCENPGAAANSERKAVAALRYWRDECSGHEPSLSVFEQKVDEVLGEKS